MSTGYAKQSLADLNALGLTDYAIVRMKPNSEARIFNRNILLWGGPEWKRKLPLSNMVFPTYQEAMEAILADAGYTIMSHFDYCLRCNSQVRHRYSNVYGCDCANAEYDAPVPAFPPGKLPPASWISFNIPTEVAVCPICGAPIEIEEITEWETATGIPTESGFHINCSTQPGVGTPEAEPWWNSHWSAPYVDWVPLNDPVYKWLRGLALASLASTAVFMVSMSMRGFDNSWQLPVGTESKKIFVENGLWWVRFPGGVDFLLGEVVNSPDMFACVRR